MTSIGLTPAQIEIMNEVLAAARARWGEEAPLPEVKGTTLFLVHDETLLADLIRRIANFQDLLDSREAIGKIRRLWWERGAERLVRDLRRELRLPGPVGTEIPPQGLSIRVCNLLIRHNIATFEALAEFYDSGRLHVLRGVGPRISVECYRVLRAHRERITHE